MSNEHIHPCINDLPYGEIFKLYESRWFFEKSTIFSDYQNLGHRHYFPQYIFTYFLNYIPEPQVPTPFCYFVVSRGFYHYTTAKSLRFYFERNVYCYLRRNNAF